MVRAIIDGIRVAKPFLIACTNINLELQDANC